MLKDFTKYFLIVFVVLSSQLKATHIVGGEIYYDKLTNNDYHITLKIYRDCFLGQAPFDSPAFVTIYDANNNVVQTLNFPLVAQANIPPSINNPCIQTPNDVCVEEAIYEDVVNLPPRTGGYYIVYQRCCRNNSILNIVNPGGTGATYWEHIPGPEVVANNSCPRFNKFPPIFICNGIPIKFDHAATDPDGDVLVYSLCAPYQGLDNCCPIVMNPPTNPSCVSPPPSCPSVNTPPPYNGINFISPYSGGFPMSSNPAININSSTGFLNGVPDINGQWVVGVCVQEWRGATLIGTHYRDFQFNVVTCSVTVLAQFNDQATPIGNPPQNQYCSGYTLQFSNNSINGTNYFWNFGDPTTLADTSNFTNPFYTYPDSGAYLVTLIANPGKPCADTTSKTYYVYPNLKPTFTPPPPECIVGNSFNFTVGGLFAPGYTTFNWNFGAPALPVTSTLQSPNGVVFNAPGIFPVSVIVQQKMCIKTLSNTVEVYPIPTANFVADSVTLCDPASVTFTNNSISGGTPIYLWEYSDGGSSNQTSPTHVFSPAGVYDVTLTIISVAGCIDTTKFVVPGMITVSPLPTAGFSLTPTETSIYDPDIIFFDESISAISWNYNFGDGGSSSSQNPMYSYTKPGEYQIVQTVVNQFGCVDTAIRVVKIIPEFAFWIPNSFTPGNKDGKNDIFMPSVFGVEKYLFEIYDRWGECIFRTRDTPTGWDGTYLNKPCQQDVYVWMITFYNIVTKREEVHYGHVTLLK
ncbi:MAG: PKD domain-containing protein [Bacteroidia bacterium]|nr:PKD domain-containing protein [Bacteroidia bacterium]